MGWLFGNKNKLRKGDEVYFVNGYSRTVKGVVTDVFPDGDVAVEGQRDGGTYSPQELTAIDGRCWCNECGGMYLPHEH